MVKNDVKKIVKNHYSKVAKTSKCCCSSRNNSNIAKDIGYFKDDIDSFSDANLGLGCGNPVALGDIKEGDVVLDLGSGAGFDCFLAAKKVGNSGRVIGVDMTKNMIDLARINAEDYGYNNVEFKLGDIDNLPIENETIDIVMSNCVINLAPDKKKVFKEAYRVLKKNGKMYVSDIVLLKELLADQRKDVKLIASCVGGALLKNVYLNIIKDVGFTVSSISEDKEISKKQYQGISLESLSVVAIK